MSKKKKRFSMAPVIIVVVLGFFLVNGVEKFTKEEYQNQADEIANYIVSEFERQSDNGVEPSLDKIVSKAQRLDESKSLKITYSDGLFEKSFIIFLELDGGKVIKFKDVVLDLD
ncbi:MAG: hypothetical protein N4A40_13125 [Tissierellales bacterium]|jgi:hypothetical protein|nr:hypothetical protein [Tissierellales bacterium]